MMEKLPATINDVMTPCFLVDIDKVKNNAQTMIDRCKKLGVQLRPHMKTHKTIEGGEILTGGTKRCIEVSTLDEAEFFAKNGFEDILFGYPITSDRIPRCQKLTNKLDIFKVMTDSQEGVDVLKSSGLDTGKKWSTYLEIDFGMGRTGVPWESDQVLCLARQLQEADNIDFQGLYVHTGDSYMSRGKDQLQDFGKRITDKFLSLKKTLADNDVTCKSLCVGSTPNCSSPHENMSAINEFTPGNYVFYDFMQYLIGSCCEDDIACRVATRVISHKPSLNQLAIDCGFLGISKDGFDVNLATGPCMFQNNLNLKLHRTSQEIGQVTAIEGNIDFSKYPIGKMLFMYPFHSCATAAQYPIYHIHSGDKIIGTWRPTRGW